jgi:transposase-like protein
VSPISSSTHASRDWAAIAQAYAAPDLTVTDICERYKVPRTALYVHIREQGWEQRSDAVSQCQRRRAREQDFAKRLMNALEKKMTAFENRMAQGDASAADSERDARTLNTLVRLFDKLSAHETSRVRPRAGAPSSHPKKDAIDADSLRHDLARRLEKLRASHGG